MIFRAEKQTTRHVSTQSRPLTSGSGLRPFWGQMDLHGSAPFNWLTAEPGEALRQQRVFVCMTTHYHH